MSFKQGRVLIVTSVLVLPQYELCKAKSIIILIIISMALY